MMRRLVFLALSVGTALACCAGQTTQAPTVTVQSQAPDVVSDADEALPTIHVTTRLVVLDVVVSDGHGHAGAGLKASDFKLIEDGVPQTIDSFTEHDVPAPGPPSEEDALPRNTFTVQAPVKNDGAMTVIVIAASRWDDFIHAQLRDYFRTAPTTPTAIFRSDRIGMHLIQGLTTDPKLLVEAATSKRIWMVLGPKFHADPASFRVRGAGPRTQRLAAYLAGIPGRINVIWLGSGAPAGELTQDFQDESSSLADVSDMVDKLNGATSVRRLSRLALYSVRIGGCAGGNRKVLSSNGGRSFGCTFPREAMQQIAATDSHYYTISYRPANRNWNGSYRRIHIDVAGYAQPPFTIRWSQLITGWSDDIEPTLMYRNGYFADSVATGDAAFASAIAGRRDASANGGVDAEPRRKLALFHLEGDLGPNEAQIKSATEFGSPTPVQMPFTIVVTPAPETEKITGREELPDGNLLTTPFRDGPYRNYRIHYSIDPKDLRLVQTASGRYQDDVRTIVMVYRDDGVIGNSLSTRTHLDVSPEEAEAMLASGLTLDQSIAVPTTENFFIRTTVAEQSSGHVGAIEVPVEWIKLEPAEVSSIAK